MKLIEKLKKQVARPAHPLLKTIAGECTRDFTFSYRGQRFKIEATDDAQAWERARMLVGESYRVFLVSKSAPQCKIRYELA